MHLRIRLPRISAIALFATVVAASALAQDRVEQTRQQLEEITDALASAEASRTALQAEIETLSKDRAGLNTKLIATAGEVQASEARISELEDRLEELGIREQDLRQALRERRDVLAHLIAALQRVGRNPPPALLVHPDDALASIRSAIALGAVVPQMRGQAEALVADLSELTQIRASITSDRDALTRQTDSLRRDQARLALLMEIKHKQIEKEQAELARLQEKSERLAENAQSFKDLIGKMEAEIDRFRTVRAQRAEAIASAAEDGGSAINPDQYRSYYASLPKDEPAPENPLVAKSDPNRIAPAIPFAQAKALLPMPARGRILAGYGDEDSLGDVSQGVSIVTRTGAQVVSPSDGWVVYAGPFRSYRQLLIIDAGDGYHVVIAGMDRVNASLGQFVLAGEPVGSMSAEPVRVAASVLSGGKSQPVLYVEFRKDGKAIDPAPWWADKTIASR
ncbi:MAG: peptidoglycan DD-metalloendopeptidase family protein [Rhodobiaceae bacterium]|nr:peptidoglycan DD-metalloendopeptidase family protein [Rhodobiaceae bacterium]